MIPTLLGVGTAAYLFWRADGAQKQGRHIFALVLCILAATLLIEGVKVDADFFKGVYRALSQF